MTRRRRSRNGPVVIGLTGSIAMGKSTAAAMLRRLGIPIFDADAAVHKFLGPKGAALTQIARRFPGVVGPNGVDRKKLGGLVFNNPAALADLEAIIHPLVDRTRAQFMRAAGFRRESVIALDVPLLLEGTKRHLYDVIAVVSAPAFLQRQRALRRVGMTAERLEGILARQMPDAKKRALADVVIPTGLNKRETLRRLRRLIKIARKADG
ncbi:MAG: dephospho-CoA kinase [Candidatus Binataceae bacterium]